VIGFAAIFGLAVATALAFLVLWMRARRALAAARELRSPQEEPDPGGLLETLPIAAFFWRPGVGEAREALPFATAMREKSYADFLARLAPADAARIEAERRSLTAEKAAFSAMAAADGALYAVEGRRTGAGASILWLIDAAALAKAPADRAGAEAAPLRELFAALPFPLWRRGRDLRLSDCNPAYAAALDASPQSVLAEGRELAPSGARDNTLRLARGASRSERRHVVIAGSRRLLEITELPSAQGGTIGFALDRTDLETAEAELARHISAHGEVLENIHAAVAIYGPDKRLKFFNSAFAALWGLEEEWLRAEPLQDEVLERLREKRRIPEVADFRDYKRRRADLFTSLIEPQQELLHLPDERTLSLLISPHPFGGLTFLFEDVTDRLALERSYNTLTEVQRATLDHLFEGIAVYGSDGRLKLHNPAYRRIWGLSAEDVAGEPHIGEIVEKSRAYLDDGADWEEAKRDFIAKVTAGAPANGRLERRDGSVLDVASVPLPDGNVLLSSLDVTDTAWVERALRERNQALETAGRLKSEFIANVSYELRTPLNAISGFAEILTNQYFGPLSARQLDYSRGILESAHRLTTLINDILDLATIEAGYMALDVAEIDVRAMLEAVVALTRERARDRDLSLECRCPADIGRIEGDEKRLKQALFNLVSNAIKFTPAGGGVRISAERTASELLLTVADTGKGIAPADQNRIFEKFERGHPKDRESGAGLGLSLVKSFIELHGGTVALDSAPGKGTRVTCRLPLAPQGVGAAA
jgi:nitrogen-specific signal transduction histidine kinase